MEKTCLNTVACPASMARLTGWTARLISAFLLLPGTGRGSVAETVPDPANTLVPPPLPEVGESFFRVFGALGIVLALFLAGVWLYRNWQRLAMARSPQSQLKILEGKSLGNRQSLFIVGYRNQRLMLGTSAAGISLITHLPEEEGDGSKESAGTRPPRKLFSSLLDQSSGKSQ